MHSTTIKSEDWVGIFSISFGHSPRKLSSEKGPAPNTKKTDESKRKNVSTSNVGLPGSLLAKMACIFDFFIKIIEVNSTLKKRPTRGVRSPG
jgi:hypothetical protein